MSSFQHIERSDLVVKVIFETKAIAMHYLKTYFVIDMLSSIPWVLFYTAATEYDYTDADFRLNVLK